MEKSKNVLFFVLSVFLAVAIIFGSAFMVKNLGWFKQPITVAISDSGKVVYNPDQVEVSLSVVTKGINPDSVQAENDKKMTAIVEYLKALGVKEEDIKTTSYNLYPEYDQGGEIVPPGAVGNEAMEFYRPNTYKIIGYTLEQSLSFKSKEIGKIGEIVGGLTDKGANRVNSIWFSLSDEKTEELKAEAREKAVAKAKKELETMKSLYGLKKAKLVSINDYPVYPSVRYGDLKAMGVGGDAEVSNVSPIEAGTGELEVQVSLTYELK